MINEDDDGKVIIFMTSGPKTPERCATPFYTAAMACVMDAEASVFCQIDGAALMKKGVAANLEALEGGKTILGFIQDAKEAGVEIYVCSAAMQLHDMTEDDLIEECNGVVGAAYMVEEGLEANLVLTY